MTALRRHRRTLLLVVLPLAALLAGGIFYLNGGRYVTTDDAYVGAQKVLITPDISGKIEKVVVREGQRVNEGDVLFREYLAKRGNGNTASLAVIIAIAGRKDPRLEKTTAPPLVLLRWSSSAGPPPLVLRRSAVHSGSAKGTVR